LCVYIWDLGLAYIDKNVELIRSYFLVVWSEVSSFWGIKSLAQFGMLGCM